MARGDDVKAVWTLKPSAYLDPTALYKMGARYYNESTGRFTQPDPSGQELNRYNYSASIPTTYSDPSGLQDFGCEDTGTCDGIGNDDFDWSAVGDTASDAIDSVSKFSRAALDSANKGALGAGGAACLATIWAGCVEAGAPAFLGGFFVGLAVGAYGYLSDNAKESS